MSDNNRHECKGRFVAGEGKLAAVIVSQSERRSDASLASREREM